MMEDGTRKSWLARLRAGLGRTSGALANSINDLFAGGRKLDDAMLRSLEDLLITTDVGVATAAKLTASLGKGRFDQDISGEGVRVALADEISLLLEPVAAPLSPDPTARPHVVLVCGVNGSGKTTTIGKLAHRFSGDGLKVVLAAGDTFRAAAVEQLKIWGERAGVPVIARDAGSDPAGLAYDAYEEAKAAGADILMIDTAGRLQNRGELMAELQKVVRVLKKLDPAAPHSTLLVLDATVGQNAHSQVEIFREMVNVTGLVVTKLDGSAKGGVLVALAERFGLPVHAVGVGEQIDDLRPFAARDFARALLDLPAD